MVKEIFVPEMKELRFDDAKHIYSVNDTAIPSVTTIMKPLTEAKYKGIDERTLNNAADKGTAVHNAIENFIKFGITDISPEHKPFVDAFEEWWNKTKPEVIGSEIRIYHKLLMYGGTIDLLCIIDGKLTLIDFKTTYTVSDMLCGVQLEAYSQGLASQGIKVQEKRILQLKKDGKYAEFKYPANDANRWRVFGSLKCVYDYIKQSA